MAKFIVAAILSVVLMTTLITAEDVKCGENQEFVTCGTACPPKCNDTGLSFCTAQCVIGCQCKRGLLLNDKGECVTRERC